MKYSEKQQRKTTAEKEMFDLAWELHELESLNTNARELIEEIRYLKMKLLNPHYDRIADNFVKKLCCFKEKSLRHFKIITKYRRSPATHILVVMISPEERNKKPYAIPVQCIAYASLTDNEVRNIFDKLVEEMTKRQMKVAGIYLYRVTVFTLKHLIRYIGCATNGEWNTLRSKGYMRPISVLEIRAQIRRKYSKLGLRKLNGMLTPAGQLH